jgi:tetratricopeptide (TPR) repeat protein
VGATEDRAIETLYGLGLWLLEQSRTADAVHVFRTMMMSAPDDERSWLGLGLCHEQKGELTVARDLYGLATSAQPHSFRCPLALARLLRQQDEEDRAEQSYELAEERARALDESEIAAAIAHERMSS